MKFVFVLAAAAIGTLPVAADAASFLTNGSFEAPNLGTGNYTYPAGTLDSWTYASTALVNAQGYSAWYGNTAPAGQDGAQFAALQGSGTLSQTFTAAKGELTVSWLAGGRPNFGSYAGDQSYTVALDGKSLGTFSAVSGQAFAAKSVIVTGLTGTSHTLTFTGLATTDETAFIDNVAAGAVPEPAVWGLMIAGFGLVGVAGRRRAAIA